MLADPENRRIYEEEAAKKELWLQLVEARLDARVSLAEMADRLGVSRAQMARIERSGYDFCTVTTLQEYVQTLGDGFAIKVADTREGA